MVKYKEYYKEMIANNKELFDSFKEVHDNFVKNGDEWKSMFNEVGKNVVEVIRDYERRLCASQESGMYGKYSSKLADKFWDQVRKEYPKIDFVGVK